MAPGAAASAVPAEAASPAAPVAAAFPAVHAAAASAAPAAAVSEDADKKFIPSAYGRGDVALWHPRRDSNALHSA